MGLQVKVNMDLYSASKVLRDGTRSERISQFYMHTLRSSANGINYDLPFPSQLKLVLIYQPRRDGRLSWPE